MITKSIKEMLVEVKALIPNSWWWCADYTNVDLGKINLKRFGVVFEYLNELKTKVGLIILKLI